GFQPRTPSYFLCGQKVTKKPHKGGTLSMGSLPYGSLPHDDTKGATPPLESPQPVLRTVRGPLWISLRGRSEFALAPRFSPKAKTLVRRTPGESPNETCLPLTGR